MISLKQALRISTDKTTGSIAPSCFLTTKHLKGPAAGAATFRKPCVWKTKKASTGTCRQFFLRLDDSNEHTAFFKFIK